MWVRGLKQKSEDYLVIRTEVAPHVGAWIETVISSPKLAKVVVAPHVGAWIETIFPLLAYQKIMSHPMWVRGLKQLGIAR